MKYFVFIAVCLLLAVHLSEQIPRLVNCPGDFLKDNPSYADICGTVTCHEDGTRSAVGCGTWACMPGKTIGYRETDNSKQTPDCCGGPICAD